MTFKVTRRNGIWTLRCYKGRTMTFFCTYPAWAGLMKAIHHMSTDIEDETPEAAADE